MKMLKMLMVWMDFICIDLSLLWGNIDQIENYFLEEKYVSSHHSILPFFPCNEKETSCAVNSSSDFSVATQEEGFHADNETLWSHRWLC
jgi:hypothetical protein